VWLVTLVEMDSVAGCRFRRETTLRRSTEWRSSHGFLAYAPNMRPARIVALALIVLTSAGCPDEGAPSDVGIETQVPIRPASNGKIAFLLGSGGILGPSPLYVAGSNTPARRIGVGDITSFAWSPDGTRIVYVQAAGEFGGGWIKLVGADGSANRTLVRTPNPLSGIAWSPDGRWIVYGQGIGMAPNGRQPVPALR
jgi:hypothetical protein